MNSLARGLSATLTAIALLAFNAAASDAALRKVTLPTDTQSLQRGAETVTSVCMGCHSLKYIKYRDLLGIGIPQDQVDTLRADRENSEPLLSMTPPDAALAAYGVVPPDLSLMARAREGGPRYIYTLLTSFYLTPDGNTNNHLYPGTRMPDVLGWSATPEGEGRDALDKTASEVAAFLNWTADPSAAKRHQIGIYVMVYLVVFTTLLFLLKQREWKRLDQKGPDGVAQRQS
jgi:cytochrome c1